MLGLLLPAGASMLMWIYDTFGAVVFIAKSKADRPDARVPNNSQGIPARD
jgi:hypothetical protein